MSCTMNEGVDQLKHYFEIKDFEGLKTEIYRHSDYQYDLRKLSYLVSAFYYSSDFDGAIASIALIQKISPKIAYSMLIDTHICIGTDEDAAMGCVEAFLAEEISEEERHWAYFKLGQCHLAKGSRKIAAEYFEKADLRYSNSLSLEKHFFINNMLSDYHNGSGEGEKINCMIIRSRVEADAGIAKDSISEARRLNYGEGEYFASVVLAKYLKDDSEFRRIKGVSSNKNTIYFRLI